MKQLSLLCVAYNAIRLADIQRNQLAASAKASVKKCTKREEQFRLSSCKALLKKNYIKVMGNQKKKASRDDIKKLKPF